MNVNRVAFLNRSIRRSGLLAFALAAWFALFEMTWGCWAAAPLCG